MLEEWKAMVIAMDIDGDGMISYSDRPITRIRVYIYIYII